MEVIAVILVIVNAEIKTLLNEWVSEWDGHLLSMKHVRAPGEHDPESAQN